MNAEEWRYQVRPECLGKAQEAVAQMRALGMRVELRRGDLLVFTIGDTGVDHRAAETLERVWPGWRECVSAPRGRLVASALVGTTSIARVG